MIRNRAGALGTLLRLATGLILAAPIAWAMWASLQPVEALFAPPSDAAALPSETGGPHWDNYVEAVTRLPFLRFLINSCLITLCATVGTVLSCSLAGFAFARLHWRGRDACFVVLLATMMLPAQVMLIPQFLIFEHLGWVNTYNPLIVPSWLGASAFSIFLFRQFFRGVPQSYEDAARLDGATNWQVYWHVMIPAARPVVGAVAALSAVFHWQSFLAPLVYLSDFQTYPVSVGLRMYQAMEGSWANLIMAASLVALVPPLVIVILAQGTLMRGIGATRPRRRVRPRRGRPLLPPL